jgi:kynurenine 3-monooxygenase
VTSATVIGGGLVGCVAAIHLKRRGVDVAIYERYGDPRQTERRTRPSVNITLCERGLRVLCRAGLLDDVLAISAPAYGRIVHAVGGATSFEAYGKPTEALYAVSRNHLNTVLLDSAAAEGISIHFDCPCLDVNPATGQVLLAGRGGQRWIEAGCIIAADGSFSTVRSKLQRRDRFNYSQHFYDQGYREIRIPAGPRQTPRLEPGALHFWPRGDFMAVAFPNTDSSFTLFIEMPFTGPVSFEALADQPAVRALFDKALPELVPFIPDGAPDFLAQRANSMVTIRCAPWSVDGRVLLIGDAAHAILPSYGQGANAGFEDCAVLDALVERHGFDWATVFDAFERQRKPDTDAIADMCYRHFDELRVNGLDRTLQRRRQVERRLRELFPDRFVSLYSMIAFSPIPYAEAWRRHLAQQAIVDELLSDDAFDFEPDRRHDGVLAARLARALDPRPALA